MINISNPALFSEVVLTPSGGTAVSQVPAALTVFNLTPAVNVAPGQSGVFNLSGTLAAQARTMATITTDALTKSQWKSGNGLGILVGIMGFGLLLIPFTGRRNRVLLILTGAFVIVAWMPGCGSSGGNGPEPNSTQSLAAGSVSTAGVPIGGLPVTLSVVSQQ